MEIAHSQRHDLAAVCVHVDDAAEVRETLRRVGQVGRAGPDQDRARVPIGTIEPVAVDGAVEVHLAVARRLHHDDPVSGGRLDGIEVVEPVLHRDVLVLVAATGAGQAAGGAGGRHLDQHDLSRLEVGSRLVDGLADDGIARAVLGQLDHAEEGVGGHAHRPDAVVQSRDRAHRGGAVVQVVAHVAVAVGVTGGVGGDVACRQSNPLGRQIVVVEVPVDLDVDPADSVSLAPGEGPGPLRVDAARGGIEVDLLVLVVAGDVERGRVEPEAETLARGGGGQMYPRQGVGDLYRAQGVQRVDPDRGLESIRSGAAEQIVEIEISQLLAGSALPRDPVGFQFGLGAREQPAGRQPRGRRQQCVQRGHVRSPVEVDEDAVPQPDA